MERVKLAERLIRLEDDIASGVWAKNNHTILDPLSLDFGYRVNSAKVMAS